MVRPEARAAKKAASGDGASALLIGNDTDGAVMSFIEATVHSAAQISA